MKFKLTYKTTFQNEPHSTEHTLILDSYEHAKAIEYDLEHGDWGDLIAYDILITPELKELEEIDDLPF